MGIKVKQTDIQITYMYMVLGIHLLPLSKSHVITELLTSMPIDLRPKGIMSTLMILWMTMFATKDSVKKNNFAALPL